MNVWKVLAWTSPLWMMAECTVLNMVPTTTYYDPLNHDAPFLNAQDLCAIQSANCEDQIADVSTFKRGDAGEVETVKVWTVPEGFVGDGFFNKDGDWLGGYSRAPGESYIPRTVGEHLLDAREWFAENVDTPAEEWRIIEPGSFTDPNVVERDGYRGVLGPVGGWIIEPQKDLAVRMNGTDCDDTLRIDHPDEIEIFAIDRSWSQRFPPEALKGRIIEGCAYPFFMTEEEGLKPNSGGGIYEVYYLGNKIYEVDVGLLSIQAIGEEYVVIDGYFANPDKENQNSINKEGIMSTDGSWKFPMAEARIILRSRDYFGTDEPFIEIETGGYADKVTTYYDLNLEPIEKPEDLYDKEMRAKIKPPEDWQVDSIGNLSQGLAPFTIESPNMKSRVGYVDANGEIKIAPVFDARYGDSFRENGLAEAVFCAYDGSGRGCERGFIDTNGEWAIPPGALINFVNKDNWDKFENLIYRGNDRYQVEIK